LGVSQGAIYKYVECGRVTFRRLPIRVTRKNTLIKSNVCIVFELEDLYNFVEQVSEKYEPENKFKIKEKSLDNFN